MPDFSFLNDSGPTDSGEWRHWPIEHRDTGLVDKQGKRIGFEIHRSLCLRDGEKTPHGRWVSMTKDGQWIRNDYTTHHATWEQAEAEVEKKISRAIARVRRVHRDAGFNFLKD